MYFMVEALMITYMISRGIDDVIGFFTLGVVKADAWARIEGDDSIIMLLMGIFSFIVITLFVVIYIQCIKDAYRLQLDYENGKKCKTFKKFIADFFDTRFHVTALSLPVIGVCIFNVLPIVFMILLVISTVAYLAPLETKDTTDDLVDCTDYIIANDPDYHNHSVITPYSFASISKFYLQTNVTPVAEANITSMNDTYLIIDRNITADNYNLTHRFGNINLYTHV